MNVESNRIQRSHILGFNLDHSLGKILLTLKYRWHDEKVSSLELAAPLSILPDLSVEQAINIMNEEGYDQLPVIDEMG